MANVLVVTSGKGGVGKTTTTAALGAALRSAGTVPLIAKRPYNNRYDDAAGAREDYLG